MTIIKISSNGYIDNASMVSKTTAPVSAAPVSDFWAEMRAVTTENQRRAQAAASQPQPRGIAAKFPGTCKTSGRRYGKGARIEQTCYGWSLVDATVDLGYQMDREDSAF